MGILDFLGSLFDDDGEIISDATIIEDSTIPRHADTPTKWGTDGATISPEPLTDVRGNRALKDNETVGDRHKQTNKRLDN